MISLDYGTMPTREQWIATVPDEPFPMTIRDPDLWTNIAEIINQGIDSALEIVDCEVDATTGEIVIKDRASLWTFLRRCTESDWGDADQSSAIDWASGMMEVLGFEWI